ncbi:hypothetical protein Murru_1220 [Allomuricauda ruestringensis DSM 13258]|uniref:Uncharacterized protein n=1 Tax=Allomuricauda ruestringensis (strain DSM 13258 / CIP 107369 / LMG 19739 / B1) TaxID=886377 RepID=G2PNS8_ALLRU|nr:hypothetical protein Murru_1220 [Allomuricauda ruestringensis DSM 13258]
MAKNYEIPRCLAGLPPNRYASEEQEQYCRFSHFIFNVVIYILLKPLLLS